jgi:FMN phosphatase YigB (HAD superfamily)
MLLTDFDALTFDCYGTLIDWESGIIEALRGLTDRVQRPLTREQILEAHARHESSQQRYTPAKLYRDLLPIVYKRLAEEWNAWRPNAHLHPSQVIVDSDVEIETIAVAPHKPAPIVREFMTILKSEFVAKSEISTLR